MCSKLLYTPVTKAEVIDDVKADEVIALGETFGPLPLTLSDRDVPRLRDIPDVPVAQLLAQAIEETGKIRVWRRP